MRYDVDVVTGPTVVESDGRAGAAEKKKKRKRAFQRIYCALPEEIRISHGTISPVSLGLDPHAVAFRDCAVDLIPAFPRYPWNMTEKYAFCSGVSLWPNNLHGGLDVSKRRCLGSGLGSRTVRHGPLATRAALSPPERKQPGATSQSRLGALSSPPQRYYDFSSRTVDAVRVRHCRVFEQEKAQLISQKVRGNESSLADLCYLLSECQTSRKDGGDIGWYTVPEGFEAPGDELKVQDPPRRAHAAFDATQATMNSEFLEVVLSARPGALQMVQLSYGWEVFVLEDIRHGVVPTLRGARRGPGFPVTPNMRRTSPKKPRIDPMSYYIQTFGCQMNVSDSERIEAELQSRGLHPTSNPDESAIYLLNTCALRDHAEQKVYSYLGPHAQRKWDAPSEVMLIVAGCVAQQEGDQLLSRVPELDIVMGPQYANRIGELLDDFKRNMAQIVAVDPIHIQEDISKPVRSSKLTAWVNIIYGCLEKCTYCVVPNTRGLEQSRPMEAIRKELEGLGREGYREVVLLGQNVDAYGRDLYPKRTFAQLLRYLHDVDGIERIRFTTGHPRYISGNLIAAVSELPKVMEHFHVPPQSGDNSVLRDMGRGYSRERYIEIAGRIRASMPDASICADTIVGFPGESDFAFKNTVSLIDEVVFDSNMVRSYSARPNTPAAARMDQVDEEVKAERLGILNRKMREQAETRSKRYLGRKVEVLVEGCNPKNKEEMMGRERSNRVVFFKGRAAKFEGKIVDVLIEEAFAFSLRGRVVGEPW